MEFFVGNLIVAGLSDWGCVLIPTGLPSELHPHGFCVVPDDLFIIAVEPENVNGFFAENQIFFLKYENIHEKSRK